MLASRTDTTDNWARSDGVLLSPVSDRSPAHSCQAHRPFPAALTPSPLLRLSTMTAWTSYPCLFTWNTKPKRPSPTYTWGHHLLLATILGQGAAILLNHITHIFSYWSVIAWCPFLKYIAYNYIYIYYKYICLKYIVYNVYFIIYIYIYKHRVR